MKRLPHLVFIALLVGAFPAQGDEAALKLALQQALDDSRSFKDRYRGQVWLSDMSKRLEKKIPDPFYRLELLKIIHEEATRAGLQPELVLSVIQVESGFDRFAVSPTAAQGLMQVMPFWKKEIGHPRDNLFHPRTNLRYGCTILKYYLDREKGNVAAALSRYNGSRGSYKFPKMVFAAMRTRWYVQ